MDSRNVQQVSIRDSDTDIVLLRLSIALPHSTCLGGETIVPITSYPRGGSAAIDMENGMDRAQLRDFFASSQLYCQRRGCG